MNAAGASAASIAATANLEGIAVPRQTGVDPRLQRYPSGHALGTEPGNPGKWTAAAVTELLAVAATSGGSWDEASDAGPAVAR